MMVVAVATGIGLQKKIQEKVSVFNGHVIISRYDSNLSDISAKPISIYQDFYPKFTAINGVKHIQGVANKGGVIRTETDFEGVQFKGVGKDYDWTNFKDFITLGRLPNVLSKNENNEIILSEYLARRLGFELNDEVVVYFPKPNVDKNPNRRNFKVVGFYNSGFENFDKTIIFGDIRHIQRMNKWLKDDQGKYVEVGSFEVFLDDFNQLDIKSEEIYNNSDSFLNVNSISEKYMGIFEWLKVFDFNIYMIIGVMILISVINMSVMLLVLILERTKLIGVLKALGNTNWSTRKIFLYNASYIVFRGLFWGNVIAIVFLYVQDNFGLIKFSNPEYYVKEIPVYINYGYILMLNLGTFLMCFLMLIIPSYVITKVSPVKAIRFE